MSWREDLVRADFDGFEFLTEDHSAKGSKRLVIHRYPRSDKTDVEDFGLEAGPWSVNAYFIGENYHLEANGFTEKLATSGAVWLNHPWLGQLWVRAHTWSRHESNDKGGYCALSIEFVAGGRAPYAPTIDKVDVAYSRVNELHTAIVDDFALEPMSNDGMTTFIADIHKHLEGLRNVISLTTLPLTWANQVLNVVAGVKNDINVLMQVPGQYAAALGSFADVQGFGANALDEDVGSSTRTRAVARLTSTAINPPVIDAQASTAVTVSAPYKINTAREAALRSQMLVVAAAQMAMADYDNANSRDAVLDSLLSAFDALLPSMSDTVFQAAVSARMALIEALLDQNLSPQVSRDIANPLPSVLLAHQMGIDEGVFIAQNGVRHPLFVVGRVYG